MRRASLHTGATCWQQILTYTELLRTDMKLLRSIFPVRCSRHVQHAQFMSVT